MASKLKKAQTRLALRQKGWDPKPGKSGKPSYHKPGSMKQK